MIELLSGYQWACIGVLFCCAVALTLLAMPEEPPRL